MATESLINGDLSLVNITIRLIMQRKEVGSIIGKKGDNIKKIRIESGAKINISDGTYAERIVTVNGSIHTILKAFKIIAKKFEEQNAQNNQGKSLVTFKLIVPASQCGSLIGKGGSKIKEIRQVTGASIQVSSEMLHNSTEKVVTLEGNSESIPNCIYQICNVMIESPPKGATIPYQPKAAIPPIIFANGRAYTIQGGYAVHQPDLTKLHQLALQHAPLVPGHNVGSLNTQVSSLVAANSLRSNTAAHVAAQAAVIAATTPATTNISISNELIGCIIGKGGSKINEIRQLSGATIKITNIDNDLNYRLVSITGTSESINLAQYLIYSSMEMHKNWTFDHNNIAHHKVHQSNSQNTQQNITNATKINNGQESSSSSVNSSNNYTINDSPKNSTPNSSFNSNNAETDLNSSSNSNLVEEKNQNVEESVMDTIDKTNTSQLNKTSAEITEKVKSINGNLNSRNSKLITRANRKFTPY